MAASDSNKLALGIADTIVLDLAKPYKLLGVFPSEQSPTIHISTLVHHPVKYKDVFEMIYVITTEQAKSFAEQINGAINLSHIIHDKK